jgi:Ca2+-binding RTX toxin-like protein
MPVIAEAFLNSLLADAAYADGLTVAMTGDDLALALSNRMTPALGRNIGQNFIVADIATDSNSGLDAVVWRGKPNTANEGKIYVSFRGTSGAQDALADLDLAGTGLAHGQLAAMVNWWLRETTPAGSPATQIGVQDFSVAGVPIQNFVAAQSAVGTGLLSTVTNITSVAGHSLGGYLATAFNRIFGQRWPVLLTNTFNSAGFSALATLNIEHGFSQIADLVGSQLGFDSFSPFQNNFFAENGINLTTNSWAFAQYGTRIALPQEDGVLLVDGGASNHFMYKLTDLLAIGSALEKLDPSLGWASLRTLLRTSSNEMAASYERLLDTLRLTFLGAGQTPTPVGDQEGPNGGPQPASRVAYHDNLQSLLQAPLFASLANKLVFQPVTQVSSLEAINRSKFGDVAALISLSPFSLVAKGEDGQAALDGLWESSIWHTQYQSWLADKALLSVDQEPETFTNEYLADRSRLLQAVLTRNEQDNVSGVVSRPDVGPDRVLTFRYQDPISGSGADVSAWNATQGAPGTWLSRPPQLIAFGTPDADTITGTDETLFGDHLYGGNGDDTINALDGDDYVEGGLGDDLIDGGKGFDTLRGGRGADVLTGGAGNDVLAGGSGADTYLFNGATGLDVVRDSDGEGSVLVDMNPLSGGKKFAQDTWRSDDGQVTYIRTGGSLVIRPSVSTGSNGVVMVEKWKPGDLGIVLSDEPASEPDPANTLLGDFAKATNAGGTTYVLGSDGQYVSAGTQPGAQDILTGTSGPDRIEGRDGDDALLGMGGDDVIDGGDGNDVLMGGLGADRIIGGAGRDLIFGSSTGALQYPTNTNYQLVESSYPVVLGEGFNWRLSSPGLDTDGFQHGFISATVSRDTQPGDQGNVIDAGPGDDIVYAGSGNDVVHAGGEDDQVSGLAGDDVVFGDDGNDRIYGDGPTTASASESIVYTPAAQHGNDVLIGGAGRDLLIGQGGNDVLYGGTEDDVLFGDDRVDMSLVGDDYLDGGDGNDTLYAGAGDDILVGGAGDDTLHGGTGRDIYVFNRGDGIDLIDDSGRDSILRLGPGVTSDDIALGLGSLLIDLGGGDQVHFADFDPLDARGSAPVAAIEFSDGSALSANELLDRGFDIEGSGDADHLQGTSVDDRMRGFSGADQMASFGGNDTLDGGDGDDFLDAGDGDDMLIGGAGNDTLVGGAGDDVYQFAAGSGHDRVSDALGSNEIVFGEGIAATSISASLVNGQLVVASSSDDAITVDGTVDRYRFSDGTVLTHEDMLSRVLPDAGPPPTRVNGTDANDVLTGGPGDDVLVGGAGDDTLEAGPGVDMLFGDAGVDVLHGGDGPDVLAGGAGDDALYGDDGSDRLWGQDGNDTLYGGTGDDELSGGDGADVLVGGPGKDMLVAGGAGTKTYRFEVGDGEDVIAFASGTRHVEFGPGVLRSNVQLFSSPADAGSSYVRVRYNATDSIVIQLGAGAGALDYRFADGTVVSHSALAATATQAARAPYIVMGTAGDDSLSTTGEPSVLDGGAGNDTIDGSEADDVLRGGSGNDTLRARGGNDTLEGGPGDDLLVGGSGSDVYLYARGDGSDVVTEQAGGVNVLRFGDLNAGEVRYTRQSNGSLLIHIGDSSDTIEVRDWYTDPTARLQQIVYADGTTVDGGTFDEVAQASITSTQPGSPLTGTDFDDVILGSQLGEHIDGRGGNDLLTGAGGADVYSLRWGMGLDTVVETGSERNILQLEAGVDLEQLVLKQDGNDLLVELEQSGNGVRLKDYCAAGAQGWFMRGLDGTETALSQLLAPGSAHPTASTIQDMRSAWLAEGERYYAAAYTDPANGAGSNDAVSFSELSTSDDVRDMYRESVSSESRGGDGFVTVQVQVPEYRYDVQDLGQGELLIRDFRHPAADGQPTAYTYNPDEGVQFDWIGNFDTGTPATPMRTIDVKVRAPAGEFHINVESITGGPGANSIGTEGFGAVDGGAGDDVIWGMWSVNQDYEPGQFLYGGDGNDFIMGSFGKDMVIGGPGDDYLAGSYGPDTYMLLADEPGTKIIDEAAKYWSVPGVFHRDENLISADNLGYQDEYGFYDTRRPRNDDTVLFGAGITLDNLQMRRGQYTSPHAFDANRPDPADQQFDTLDFAWGDGQMARVLLQQPSRWGFEGDGTGIELFRFADGTMYTMAQMQALVDSREASTLTLWRGDGPQSLVLSPETTSVTLGPGILAADVAFARDASDLVLSVTGTADQWRLLGWFDDPANISSFAAVFVDGTRWTAAQMQQENRAPLAAAIAEQIAVEDRPWTFQVSDGTFTDPDAGDVLTWSDRAAGGGALPAWLHFDAQTHTFSGTPSNSDVGLVTLELTATDRSGAVASSTFDLSVSNVNDAPVQVSSMTLQSAAETRPFAFAVPASLFSDDDTGDVLTTTLQQADGQPLPDWIVFDADHGLVHGQPRVGDAGTWTLLLTATDRSGATASQPFDLVVSHAPVVATPPAPIQALEDSPLSVIIPDDTFVDADAGDTLSFAATSLDGSPLPAWLTFDASSRTFTGTPHNDDVGVRALAITATDVSGASASTALQLRVVNVNDAPVALNSIPDQQALEDAAWQYAIAPGTFFDADVGDQLTYSARLASGDPLPAWMHFNANAAVLSGTPSNEDVGTSRLAITATDSAGTAAESTFTIHVANVNDAPVAVGSLPAWALTAGDAGTYSVPASAFSDCDVGDTLSLSTTLADGRPLPSWMKFDAASRSFSGSPMPADAGDLLVRVIATDTAGASATQSLALQIKAGLTLQGSSGSDTLTGRGGNDVLDGGAGADRMVGGKGDDTYYVGEAGDVVVELANEGADSVHSAVTYTLPANVEQLFLEGSARGTLPPLPVLPARAMVPGLAGTGNGLDNLLVGNAENNVLTGLGGNDTIDGRAGSDTLIGGVGNDQYLFGRGAGRDTIEENDATAGNTDSILFAQDVHFDQLWFRKQGNDLQVSVIGADDLLTVSNWYKGKQYHVEQFIAADGKMLLDSRVQQLVDAMAAFSPPAVGQGSLPATYQQQLAPLLAANWQ